MSIIDPTTGDVRPAGEYTRSEWQQITRDNPDLASLILELRRKENEIEDLQNNSGLPLAMAGLTAGAAFPYAYNTMPRVGQEFATRWNEWGNQSYGLKESDPIYKGNRVRLTIEPDTAPQGASQLNLWVDGSLERPFDYQFDPNDLLDKNGDPLTENTLPGRERKLIKDGNYKKQYRDVENIREVLDELRQARVAMAGREADKKIGRKLYVMAPSENGMFATEAGRKKLSALGFQPGTLAGKEVWLNDNRPGAELLGQGYHLIDDAMARYASGKPVKGLRFAGALLGALGLGYGVGTGIGFLNERV